jgi:hypothetical protein
MLACPEASARASRADGAVTKATWTAKCEARASRNGMRRKLRAPFIEQCVAGYRINASPDLQDRKQKF